MALFERGRRPTSNETWDAESRILQIETTYPLTKGLTEASIAINVGKINVTSVEEPNSFLVTTLNITADSEKAARDELRAREESFQVTYNKKGELHIDGSSEKDIIRADDKIAIVEKDGVKIHEDKNTKILTQRTNKLIVAEQEDKSAVVEKGTLFVTKANLNEIIVKGKPLGRDNPVLVPLPEVRREINLYVAHSTSATRYNLTIHVGDGAIKRVYGIAEVTAKFSGNVTIDEFEGQMKINCPEGEIKTSDSGGEFTIRGGEKDVLVNGFGGEMYADTQKGDITVRNATFSGESVLHSDNGNLNLSANNGEDLYIIVHTHGKIVVPGIGFNTIFDNRSTAKLSDSRKNVEGHLINSDSLMEDVHLEIEGARLHNELELISDSGDITLEKSNDIEY